MPVLVLECPKCGHEFRSVVLAGTRRPEVWVCGECGSREAALKPNAPTLEHPWEKPHGKGCPCCGG